MTPTIVASLLLPSAALAPTSPIQGQEQAPHAASAPATRPAPPDPLRLRIGRSGEATVWPGQIRDLRNNSTATVADVARAAAGHRFVYLGESHDQLSHHKMQAAVIDALVAAGRDVIVGFEMLTRPVQDRLDGWTLGWWSEDEFLRQIDWQTQWGMDFALYRPVFEAVRRHRLPMVALNVPRAWVRTVGREGFGALGEEERAQVPEPYLGNADHRAVFSALMGGHPTGGRGENIYAAQVLWDEAMADSALRYLDRFPRSRNTVMVMIVGSGHAMYGQGINWRVWRRTGELGLSLIMTTADRPITVSRGLGDFVFVAPSADAGGQE